MELKRAKGKPICCTFCGKPNTEVEKVVAGPNVYICNECVDLCVDICNENKAQVSSETIQETPKSIVEFMNKHIINQTEAKKILAVAVFKHLLRMKNPECGIEKSNVLLVGPSGCGKTHFARTIAKMLNVPFAVCDATSLTEAGYVGDDVETVLARLLKNADGDVSKAEQGIIFVDEIDKKANRNNAGTSRDVSGEGVQQALLKLVEGTELYISPDHLSGNDRKDHSKEKINTANILFMVSGAFVNVSKTNGKVTHPDLQKFGLIPEFVGRFPVIAEITQLGVNELKDILTKPENSLVSQQERLFSILKNKLVFTDGALTTIAQKALERNTGARALKSIIEETLLMPTFELAEHKNETCTIDENLAATWTKQKKSKTV